MLNEYNSQVSEENDVWNIYFIRYILPSKLIFCLGN